LIIIEKIKRDTLQ